MLITLEGPDGSGKSSQIGPLAEFLSQQGYSVVTTREPGGTAISDQVRTILARMDNKAMYPRTETLLFCSARAQLVDEVIRPALARGDIVLSDRYADSTLAYQGYGHGNDLNVLRQLLNFATGSLWPDFTLLLDLEAEEGLKRRRTGGGEWNRLDDYALAFHQRVRQGYLEMAAHEPERWQVINANAPLDVVQQALRQAVAQRLEKLARPANPDRG